MADITTQIDPNLPLIPEEKELTDQLRWRLGHAEALTSLYRSAFQDLQALSNELSSDSSNLANHTANMTNTHVQIDSHIAAAAPHSGHETPTGAQNKVDTHANVASPHSGHLIIAGQIGGNQASPYITGIQESGGPTNLTIGNVADGQLLKRDGANVVGYSFPSAFWNYYLMKPSDQTSNTTANTAVSNMAVYIPANANYYVEYDIQITTSSGRYMTLGFDGPAGANVWKRGVGLINTNLTSNSTSGWGTVDSFGDANAACNQLVRITLLVDNAANAGNANLWFKSDSNGANVTIKAGSMWNFREVIY